MRLSRDIFENKMKNKLFIIVYILIYTLIILLPMIHSEYNVINNDTLAHLDAFAHMKLFGYQGLYGGQVMTGWILNHVNDLTGISVKTLFMWFNFGMLATAGLSVGLMTYILTKNKLGFVVASLFTVFGVNATLHLFYCGTIFNIISVLVILPLIITLASTIRYLRTKWIIVIGALSLAMLGLAVFTFHPSLGMGILQNGGLKEPVLNPMQAIANYIGIFSLILLVVSIYSIWQGKVKIDWFNYATLGCLSFIAIISIILGFWGLNPYPFRIIINMSLILLLIVSLLIGFALNNKNKAIRYGTLLIAGISVISNLADWVLNRILLGV